MEIKNKYTRKVQREYNRILLANAKVSNESWEPKVEVDPMNVQFANDYLVSELFWLTQEQVDGMDIKEYDNLLVEAGKVQNPQ